jgi:hypothetical protein
MSGRFGDMARSLMLGGENTQAVLDSVSVDQYDKEKHTKVEISMEAIAVLMEWLETDDLDPGETLADRLQGLLVGVADEDQNGQLDENEQVVLMQALESAWEFLAGKGIDDEDISLLLNDWDDDAASRIRDLVVSMVADGEGVSLDSASSIAVTLDAVYKPVVAVRKGQKVRINKRVSGVVRLSAKQKLAIKKARLKSHNAAARVSYMKSMKVRTRLGL